MKKIVLHLIVKFSIMKLRSGCPLNIALELVGDKWSLLIIRDLLNDKFTFSNFLKSNEGIAKNILSARLKKLMKFKIVNFSHPIDNNKVKVFNYGLGGKTEKVFLSDDSASSKVSNEKREFSIVLKDISQVIEVLQIKKTDLLKLNIEGSEYELLERLIETNDIDKIKKMKVQFHENIFNAESRREEIRHKLKNTHKEIWSYYFVWERWDRK